MVSRKSFETICFSKLTQSLRYDNLKFYWVQAFLSVTTILILCWYVKTKEIFFVFKHFRAKVFQFVEKMSCIGLPKEYDFLVIARKHKQQHEEKDDLLDISAC